MKYVLDVSKLNPIGQQILMRLRVFQAAQVALEKGRPANLPTYEFRSIVTPQMRGKMRKARKAQKKSRQRNHV